MSKQQKGRAALPSRIDHQAVLRNRLGAAAAAAFNPGVKWETYAEVQREQYREVGMAVLAQLTTAGNQRGEIEVASLISARSGEPMVDLRIASSPAQISPGKAREIALLLLEAADAAENDATLNEFAQGSLGLDAAQTAALIAQLRAQRERRRGRTVGSV